MSEILTSAVLVLKSAPLSISTFTRSLLATRRASNTGVKPTCSINVSHSVAEICAIFHAVDGVVEQTAILICVESFGMKIFPLTFPLLSLQLSMTVQPTAPSTECTKENKTNLNCQNQIKNAI